MKTTMKEVVTSRGNVWIITKVMQGYNGRVRVDAKRRFHLPDGVNYYSEWGSRKYINKCRRSEGLGPIQITEW